jgi:hypothetical protein
MNSNQPLRGDSSIPEQQQGLHQEVREWIFFPGATSPESMLHSGAALSTTLPTGPTRYIGGREVSAEAPTAAILKFPALDAIDELSKPQSMDARARLIARAAVEVPLERLLALAEDADRDVLLHAALCEIFGIIGRKGHEPAVTPALLSLSSRNHPAVRYAAVEALGRLKGTAETLQRLRAMAETDESQGVRTEAREALDDLSE